MISSQVLGFIAFVNYNLRKYDSVVKIILVRYSSYEYLYVNKKIS